MSNKKRSEAKKPDTIRVASLGGKGDWITDRCPINWCDFCCITGDKCEVQATKVLPRRCPLKKGPVTLTATTEAVTA